MFFILFPIRTRSSSGKNSSCCGCIVLIIIVAIFVLAFSDILKDYEPAEYSPEASQNDETSQDDDL